MKQQFGQLVKDELLSRVEPIMSEVADPEKTLNASAGVESEFVIIQCCFFKSNQHTKQKKAHTHTHTHHTHTHTHTHSLVFFLTTARITQRWFVLQH